MLQIGDYLRMREINLELMKEGLENINDDVVRVTAVMAEVVSFIILVLRMRHFCDC